jgi:MFS family permease
VNRNDRAIVGLVMVAHALVHTYELSVPILVGVWLERFETLDLVVAEFAVTPAVVGVVVGTGYALFGLGALPGGVAADVVGSRRLITASLLGMGGSFLLLSLSPGFETVALALALWGVAASVYHPSGLALISTGVTERGTGFAYHGMAGNLGIAFGPLATTLLLIPLDWRTATALLAVPAVLGAAFAARVDVEEGAAVGGREAEDGTAPDGGRPGGGDGPDDGAGGGAAADPRAGGVRSVGEFLRGSRALFLGSFALAFGIAVGSGLFYRGALTFLPEVLATYPWLAGVEFWGLDLEPSRYAYVGLLTVGVGGQFVGGKLTDRIAPQRGLAVAFAALAVLGLSFVPALGFGLAGLVVVGIALGFTLFVVQPMQQALVAELTPPGARGLSYGYTYLGVFGVGAFGGVLAGWVLTVGSAAALFAVLAAVAVAAAALAVALTRTGT